MKKIFEDYGRVITVSVAILAIIGIIASLMPMVKDNYGSITTGFMNMADEASSNASGNGGGGGASNTPTEYGINIMQWDVSEGQDNSVVANYYVKEENQTPPQTASLNLLNVFKPMTAYAADEKTVVIDGVTYYLSDDDTVVITGNGRMMENLQSKLCNYPEIHRLTDEHFATEFQEFEDAGVVFGFAEKSKFAECHYPPNANATILNYHIKYQDKYYSITDSGVYELNIDTMTIWTNKPFSNTELANKLISFRSQVNEYMPTLVADNATVMPKNLIINEGVTNVGKSAFLNCTSLTNVTLPQSCTSIDANAFGQTSIEYIELPQNLQTIGTSAFGYTKLKEIILPDSLTSCSQNLFYGCSNLEKIVLPQNLQRIGRAAFYRCAKLNNVVLPNSIKSIGQSAFNGCSSLTDIVIPDSVTTIEKMAFQHCTNLKSAKLSNSLTILENQTFMNCTSLENVVFPENLQQINYGAFAKCASLENVEIPNSVSVIGEFAFTECTSLKSLSLPNGITSIPANICNECPLLEKIVIPNTVTTVGERAFNWCENLKEVYIPASVTGIGNYAFYRMPANSTIYCESQAVADLLVQGNHYDCTRGSTTVVVDASKF